MQWYVKIKFIRYKDDCTTSGSGRIALHFTYIYGTRCDFILINISIYFSNSCRGGEGVGNINIVPTCSTTDAYDPDDNNPMKLQTRINIVICAGSAQ